MPVTSSVPTVVTIHDMSLTLYPRYHPARRVVLNRPLVAFAAQHASAIITVSASAKKTSSDCARLRRNASTSSTRPPRRAFQPVRDRGLLDRGPATA